MRSGVFEYFSSGGNDIVKQQRSHVTINNQQQRNSWNLKRFFSNDQDITAKQLKNWIYNIINNKQL